MNTKITYDPAEKRTEFHFIVNDADLLLSGEKTPTPEEPEDVTGAALNHLQKVHRDLKAAQRPKLPEVIDRPQAVSNFSEAHQRMAAKIIEFLNEKGGRAKLSEIQTKFERETLESVKTLSVAPGSVVLDLITNNYLYLDSNWEVGVKLTSSLNTNYCC